MTTLPGLFYLPSTASQSQGGEADSSSSVNPNPLEKVQQYYIDVRRDKNIDSCTLLTIKTTFVCHQKIAFAHNIFQKSSKFFIVS
jgi:hypothetical protein